MLLLVGLDVLVNNAGLDWKGAIQDLKTEDAEFMLKFNFLVPLTLTREALPHLRKTKGNVVFIGASVRKYTFCVSSKNLFTQYPSALFLQIIFQT